MRRRPPCHRGLLLLPAALLALSSCGGDEEPSSATEPTGSAGATSPAASPTSAAATPEVAPAEGPVVDMKPFTVNLPRGWRLAPRSVTFVRSGYHPGSGLESILVSHLPVVGDESVDSLARTFEKHRDSDLRRVEDTEVAGIPAAHLAGRDGWARSDVYAMVAQGETVDITFEFEPGDAAQREKLIASVLASWQWR